VSEAVVPGRLSHFRGRSEHALDDKGRLNIPTRFRDVLRLQYDERLMIAPWHKCLRAYPLPQWEELETTLRAEGKTQPQMIKLLRFLVGGVVDCPLDKQGRVLLPPNLRVGCAMDKDVVVSGMITYFEIWDRAAWEQENRPAEEDFQAFEQIMIQSGLM